MYESKVRKRIGDLLSKARMEKAKPSRMGEEAWDELLIYCDSHKFRERSYQNKLNQSSNKGRTL